MRENEIGNYYRLERKNWCVVLREPRKSGVAALSGRVRAILAT